MRLKSPDSNIPPKGWTAQQPETGAILRGATLRNLIKEVQIYRIANNLPIEPNIRRQVEGQVCSTMSEADTALHCAFLDDDDSKNPAKLRQWKSTITDLENFGKAVKATLETAVSGEELHVSQAVADKRASVCSSCPHNLPIANCWGCGALGSIYRSFAGRRISAHDHQLRSCDVCGCDNKTQVHFTGKVLRLAAEKQGLMGAEFPKWCWKQEVLSNA